MDLTTHPSHPRIVAVEAATRSTIRLTIESEIGVMSGVFTPDPGTIMVDWTTATPAADQPATVTHKAWISDTGEVHMIDGDA